MGFVFLGILAQRRFFVSFLKKEREKKQTDKS